LDGLERIESVRGSAIIVCGLDSLLFKSGGPLHAVLIEVGLTGEGQFDSDPFPGTLPASGLFQLPDDSSARVGREQFDPARFSGWLLRFHLDQRRPCSRPNWKQLTAPADTHPAKMHSNQTGSRITVRNPCNSTAEGFVSVSLVMV
jgi:hypothetical protein